MFLADQHGIAVTVEPVPGFDRVSICSKDIFAAGEGRHQRQQTRSRQMKIGKQLIHHAKRLPWIKKYRRLGLPSRYWLFDSRTFPGGVFQRAYHRGSNREHRALSAFCSAERGRRFYRNFVGFGVYCMVLDVFGAHRLEGAESDLERNLRDLDAAAAQFCDDLRRKMQACGWRCDAQPRFA